MMIDMGSAEGRIVAAALRLAAEKPWQDVSLRHIAEAAGMNLAELSDTFSSKSDVLKAFVRLVDKEVLLKAPAPQEGESRRDALFEVIMARFDVLEPFKTALRSIAGSGEIELALMRPMLSSQAWMLQAAGIDSDGPAGAMRTAGLASAYASVLRTWLEDDDPGLARTMAVLDRRLRSGESVMAGLDSALGAARRLKDVLRSGLRSSKPRETPESGDEFGDATVAGPGNAGAPPAG
ncbi:MAG: TetR family transcriptional regulator [Alphaproteobacteria bacterium]|nr:TetR family transcriptional regulator [Alphaproteobacteria bacterium]